ncbi:MAG: 1-deoxy-D-xylulose-5-phosphate reductoisomerase [Thermomicrobiales bacterium]|nr:1-deoxy-D-xylulose-5-phosphate reductoisomerase [Thermomicrobiales bacterium]MCO5222922.1 1-deoxy-D-xylulose-5-phosphate reductoisomerase [Thermomicrobiales bacterium]
MSAATQPSDRPKTGVALIGSTGSIGTQTLDVLRNLPNRFRLVSIAAGNNLTLLADQIDEFQPALAVHGVPDRTPPRTRAGTRYGSGERALIEAVTHPDVDIVVIASSGHAALRPACEAITAGKAIALANKEIIVCAGQIIMPLARERGIFLRPIDSEHSAIWQCLGQAHNREIAHITLTASGGPFRTTPLDQLATMTTADALNHPTWSMGDKITVDSATMANKGLELIEARWLFDVEPDRVGAVIHPQSIVHSIVTFVDGSQLAQMSWPDMRIPIQLALTHPERCETPHRPLDLATVGALEFGPLDEARYPAFRLAREAIIAGGSYPTAYSIADELAVAAFLRGAIGFTDIAHALELTLERHEPLNVSTLDAVLDTVHVETARAAEIVASVATGRGR